MMFVSCALAYNTTKQMLYRTGERCLAILTAAVKESLHAACQHVRARGDI